MFDCCVPTTVWVAHVSVTTGVVFSAVTKENGDVVGKMSVADVSKVDPGIGGAESIFGYGIIQVKGVGGGVTHITEQVSSLVIFHFLAHSLCALLSGELEYDGILTVIIIGGRDLLVVGLWVVVKFSVLVLLLVWLY